MHPSAAITPGAAGTPHDRTDDNEKVAPAGGTSSAIPFAGAAGYGVGAGRDVIPERDIRALPMNSFDAVVYVCLAIAVVMGFNTGLLRSMATIIGYVAAMPFAVAIAPALSLLLADRFAMPQTQTWLVLFAVFVVTGMVLSALLRRAVSDIVGPKVSIPDRLAGSVLGAVRVGLLAVLMIVIFDRIIPLNAEPTFLAGSRLRPILSSAGQRGLKSLPPDVADYIDQLKRAKGL